MDKEFSENYKKIGLKIAYYRKLNNYTQESLAEKIGVNATFYGQAEAPNVSKFFSLDSLFRISKALDVPIYKFFLDD